MVCCAAAQPAAWTAAFDERIMQITTGDLADPRLVALLGIHLTSARAQTAAGSAHALDPTGLRSPDIRVWTIWDDGSLVGVGALKLLSPDEGEVKSMHTAEAARGRGVGSAMLRHIIAEAQASGLSRLSLETGSWPYFEPARALYARHGFVECAPFGDYVRDRNSVFLSLDLTIPRRSDS